MKRIVVYTICLCSIILSIGFAAFNNDFSQRRNTMSALEAPPYTYIDTIDLSAGDWTPDSARIVEIRSRYPGTLKLTTLDATDIPWYCGEFDILRMRITGIDSAGADSLKTGSVMVFGFRESN